MLPEFIQNSLFKESFLQLSVDFFQSVALLKETRKWLSGTYSISVWVRARVLKKLGLKPEIHFILQFQFWTYFWLLDFSTYKAQQSKNLFISSLAPKSRIGIFKFCLSGVPKLGFKSKIENPKMEELNFWFIQARVA